MKYRIISCLLVCIMLLQLGVVVSKAENSELCVAVTVAEKNGVDVKDRFERRGVAFKKGDVYDAKKLVMTDTSGAEIPFSAEPMQYYDDGSIKWMRCSFSVDMKPDELKTLYIKNGLRKATGNVECIEKADGIEIKNNRLSLRLGYRGIESIKADGVECVSEKGLNIYAVTNGAEQKMKGVDFEVIQSSDLYAKARVSGKITDTLNGEICVTLSHNSEVVDIEYRLNAAGDTVINSTGMVFDYKSDKTGVTETDFLNCGSFSLISPDNSKFRGAVSKREDTGFVADFNTVKVAPIINNAEFIWYDGVTRTNNLCITFSKTPEIDYKTVSNPPDVKISAQQFKDAGIISETEMPAAAEKFITALHWASNRLDGRFEAGSIPHDIDISSDICASFGTRNGETEFYLSYGYMMSADALLYNIITDSALSWADVVIYRGGKDEIYGANRYRTGETYGNDRFFTSHPYYGDLSGLYMAYMISGNEYLEEVFKTAIDYIYKNMYIRTNAGKHYPRRALWNGGRVSYASEAESRYLIQARGLYFAYQLYGDEKYRDAAMDIVEWAEKTQTDRGFWYQAYYDDGRAYVQSKQVMPAAKNYIYLYGIRGILEMFEYEQSDKMKNVILNCADFLCSENEKFGPGIWHPFGDADEYEVNEDNTRGKSPMSDIMAVDVLYCAYEISKKEEYFNNMLSLLDMWLCAQTPGGAAAHKIGAQGYSLQISNTIGQNLTLLRRCSEIEKLISQRYEDVVKKGYSEVAVAFGNNSRQYEAEIVVDKYSYPEITLNAYESDRGSAILGMNITGSVSGDFEKELNVTVKDSGLWQGMRNKITTPYSVTLKDKNSQFDVIHALKRPIYVKSFCDDFEAEIVEYNAEKIVLALYGADAVELLVSDGDFEIKNGEGYKIEQTGSKQARYVTVTKGGSVTAHNNEIKFVIGSDKNESPQSIWLKENGVNNISKNPDGKELNAVTEKLLGIKLFDDLHSPLTNEEVYTKAVKQIAQSAPAELEALGIEGVEVIVPPIVKTDEEAVKTAADELTIQYEGELLSSDVELIKEFIYDTKISWTSSNEAVLSSDGTLTRNNISDDNETVTLTANISKNNAQTQKEFVIKLKPKEEINWRTKVAFNDCKFPIISQKGDFSIQFEIIPDREKVNALAGLTEGALGVSAMSQLAVIVRFNPDGYIDAYNKTAYTALEKVPYKGGEKYLFTVDVRQDLQEYDVYVTKENGEKITLGKNFGFRLSAPSPGVIDTIYLPAAIEDNCFSMVSNSLAVYQKQEKYEAPKTAKNIGLSFDKYVTSKLYLPPANDNSKQSWVTDKEDMINSFNILSGEKANGEVMLYRVEKENVNCITDIAKLIGLADENSEAAAYITAENAKLLLRGLSYFLVSQV